MSQNLGMNDFVLSALVGMAETGASCSVTLYVKGTVISGELVSQKKYAEEIVDILREPLERSFKEHSANILESFNMIGDAPNGLRSEGDQANAYEFVHLSNAQFISGTSHIPSSNGAPWRGKLTSVDGFMLGKMTISNN